MRTFLDFLEEQLDEASRRKSSYKKILIKEIIKKAGGIRALQNLYSEEIADKLQKAFDDLSQEYMDKGYSEIEYWDYGELYEYADNISKKGSAEWISSVDIQEILTQKEKEFFINPKTKEKDRWKLVMEKAAEIRKRNIQKHPFLKDSAMRLRDLMSDEIVWDLGQDIEKELKQKSA